MAVPRGEMANTKDEAFEIAKRLLANGAKGIVVKAQIHAPVKNQTPGKHLDLPHSATPASVLSH